MKAVWPHEEIDLEMNEVVIQSCNTSDIFANFLPINPKCFAL